MQSRVHGCKALILWPGKVGDINARSIKANFLIFKVMGRYVNASKGELLRVPVLEWCFKCLRKYWKEWLLVEVKKHLRYNNNCDKRTQSPVETLHVQNDRSILHIKFRVAQEQHNLDYALPKTKTDARSIKKLCLYLRRLRLRAANQRDDDNQELAESCHFCLRDVVFVCNVCTVCETLFLCAMSVLV